MFKSLVRRLRSNLSVLGFLRRTKTESWKYKMLYNSYIYIHTCLLAISRNIQDPITIKYITSIEILATLAYAGELTLIGYDCSSLRHFFTVCFWPLYLTHLAEK